MVDYKTPKLKTCKNKGCTVKFPQFNSIVVWCSPKCGQEIAEARVKENYKVDTRKMRKEYRADNRSYQLRKAQDSFNAYIRTRDKDLLCISSGRITGQRHAGHYLAIGSHPELRFNEDNCHAQSAKDNSWLSGNQTQYRINLIERIGLKRVEALEGPHEQIKLILDDIKDINQHYKEKLEALKQARAT